MSLKRWCRARGAGLALACVVLPLGGCGQAPQAPGSSAAAPAESPAETEGVVLKPEEIEKAGIKTAPAVETQHVPEVMGYALVVPREAIAQAVADLNTAQASAHQSQVALARSHSLAGTPGAMPVETQEVAERQAAVDHAALLLAERRLSAVYGANAPWKDNYASPVLTAVASGASKLARVTFPLGTLGSSVPTEVRLRHLGQGAGSASVESRTLWSAPADASLPGWSFFAILTGSDVSEGERLVARVRVGSPQSGILVPFDAVLLHDGKYWCYIEAKPGVFVRTEVDPGIPTDAGYFVTHGLTAGVRIVTGSAGLLLAREFGAPEED